MLQIISTITAQVCTSWNDADTEYVTLTTTASIWKELIRFPDCCYFCSKLYRSFSNSKGNNVSSSGRIPKKKRGTEGTTRREKEAKRRGDWNLTKWLFEAERGKWHDDRRNEEFTGDGWRESDILNTIKVTGGQKRKRDEQQKEEQRRKRRRRDGEQTQSLQFSRPQKLGKYSVVAATIQKMLKMEGGDQRAERERESCMSVHYCLSIHWILCARTRCPCVCEL